MTRDIKVLELFAGSRSIGKISETLGWTVWSTDLHPFDRIDHAGDILDLDLDLIPFQPDIIWASPPCTGFSVASIGHHWTGGRGAYIPKTDTARLGMDLVRRTLEIIEHFNPAAWAIENPRGVLRKLPILDHLPRHTVTYCQYGDMRMKPTDIWTNVSGWDPRPMCKNGDPCHVSAPRGAKTGTQGLKGNYERSKIPPELCAEILLAASRQVTIQNKRP